MDERIQEFLTLSGTDDIEVAKFFLESCENDVNLAINAFLDGQSSRDTKKRHRDEVLNTLDDDVKAIKAVRPKKKAKTQHTPIPIDVDDDEQFHDAMEYEAASSLLDEGPIGVEDYVRAPIKPKTMRLVDPLPRHESRPTRRYVSDSLFESVVAPLDVDDYVVQGGDTHAQKLKQLYRPPIGIMHRGTLDEASRTAEEQEKWLLVNIQKIDVFESLRLNRDTWSNPALLSLLKKEFVFWQQEASATFARPYLQYYPVEVFPHIAVMDPRTGERLDYWHGYMGPAEMTQALRRFLDNHPFDPSKVVKLSPMDLTEKPLEVGQSEDGAFDELSEDAQLEAAIRLSLIETQVSQDVTQEADGKVGNKTSASTAIEDTAQSVLNHDDTQQSQLPETPSEGLTLRSSMVSEAEKKQTSTSTKSAAEVVFALSPEIAKKPCVLQFRLPNGKQLQATFPAATLLSELFAHVRAQVPDLASKSFAFITPFPKRRFVEGDVNTLAGSDLVPRAVLIIEED